MNLQKKNVISLITSIFSIVSSTAGLVLIGLLSIFSGDGGPITFINQLNYLIVTLQNMSPFDPAALGQLIMCMSMLLVFAGTFIAGLILLIKCFVELITFKKEGRNKKLAHDAMKLAYTLLFFFGMVMFFRYSILEITIELGLYLALGLGAFGVCLAAINFCILSEKPAINKFFRACLMLVSLAASVLVLLPTIVLEGYTLSPALALILVIANGPTSMSPLLITLIVMTSLLIVSFSLAIATGYASVDARMKKKKGITEKAKVASLIVLAIFALLFVAGSFFGAPYLDPDKSIALYLYSYIAIAANGLTFVLAIIVALLPKTKKVTEKAQEAPAQEEFVVEPEPEVEPEPVQEEANPVVEENKEAKEEAPAPVIKAPVKKKTTAKKPAEKKEEVKPAAKEEALVEKAATKKKEEAKKPAKKEEPKPEAKAETPVTKAPVKKKAATKKADEKKEEAKPEVKEEAPKKKATAKKPAEKKEEAKPEVTEEKEAAKKNTASYHLSKRASDNKWQVFRAGSTKVIKLFNTKAEAEEYTKRMAENQGVGYLSHASKGKNKGRIQKK